MWGEPERETESSITAKSAEFKARKLVTGAFGISEQKFPGIFLNQ